MEFTPESIKAFFDAAVPLEFQRATVQVVRDAYQEAYEFCAEEFSEPEAHDLRPNYRRVIIERNWRQFASFSDDPNPEAAMNAAGNCNHTLVSVEGVSMTISYADAKLRRVRSAQYRDVYAASNQRMLFPEMEPPAPPAVYLILEHDALRFTWCPGASISIFSWIPRGRCSLESRSCHASPISSFATIPTSRPSRWLPRK